jgi:hypothetical protein
VGVNHKPEALMEKGNPDSSRDKPGRRPVKASEENSTCQVDTRS